VELYQWLTGPAGRQWLARAAALEGGLAARAARLRRDLSAEQTSLLLGQLELRRRGRAKFSAAEAMFFTARGLEQATDEWIARYKAGRFLGGPVADLCCGIGGDLVGLAGRGEAVGVERDPACAIIAAANAHAVWGRTVAVRKGEIAAADVRSCEAWHIDPDRRPTGRRTTRVSLHEPAPEAIEELLAANPHAAVKLAPAATLPAGWSARAELEWISRARECRQLVAWFGALAAEPGRRRATCVDAEGAHTFAGEGGAVAPQAERIGRYLFEPDPAVLAADLAGALAGEHALATVEPGIAYLTADRRVAHPLLSAFEVDEVLALDVKRVAALVRGRGIGRLEVKVRGVEGDPAELRRRVNSQGDGEATLLVTRIAGRATAILGRRVADG
jgi:hypothetical protein